MPPAVLFCPPVEVSVAEPVAEFKGGGGAVGGAKGLGGGGVGGPLSSSMRYLIVLSESDSVLSLDMAVITLYTRISKKLTSCRGKQIQMSILPQKSFYIAALQPMSSYNGGGGGVLGLVRQLTMYRYTANAIGEYI